MNNRRKKILVLLDGLPSKINPHLWINPLNEALKLAEESNITIVSPVCLTLSLRKFKQNKDRLKKLPQYQYEIESVPCWRPRYIDFSLFPWKYRKHYIQIFTMIISLLFLIFRQTIRFDIIHAIFIYRIGYVATILGKIFRKPVIITATGSDIHQNLFPNKKNALIRKRTIDAIRWSSRIIAASEFLKKYIAEEGFGKKTDVNPRGFSEGLFFPMDKVELRSKLSLETDKKILLFIGNLLSIKGPDILIEALKILKTYYANMKLMIIGDGNEKRRLEQQVADEDLEEMVFFLGRKNPMEIPLYINASDILIVPSRNEGRPVVIHQALACGKPVVASRVGGIPETLSNGRLGIMVESENPVALADGIVKALSCSWDIEYISNYAKKYAQTQLALNVLKIYDKVCS